MYLLYFILMILTCCALALLAIPFIKLNIKLSSRLYISIALFIIIFSSIMYQFYLLPPGLNEWISNGKKHYELTEQFDHLGGVNGAISKVKLKLTLNPGDKEGWLILHKLYIMNNEPIQADEALRRAQSIG